MRRRHPLVAVLSRFVETHAVASTFARFVLVERPGAPPVVENRARLVAELIAEGGADLAAELIARNVATGEILRARLVEDECGFVDDVIVSMVDVAAVLANHESLRARGQRR